MTSSAFLGPIYQGVNRSAIKDGRHFKKMNQYHDEKFVRIKEVIGLSIIYYSFIVYRKPHADPMAKKQL